MKTASDPRHIVRRKIIKKLFEASYYKDKTVLKDQEKVDEIIEKAAPEWPIAKINKVDLAVLRLATWELMNAKAPAKAIIDEAIELAREYGSETSPGFVNGVLGTILKNR